MLARLHLASAAVVLLGALPASPPAAAENGTGQEFRDSFAGGKPELTWRSFAWSDAVVEGRSVEAAPDGDGGIGVLAAGGAGPGAVSYAETAKAEDAFELGAQIYCPREADAGQDGALTGLAFFVDPDLSGGPDAAGFYRLVCDRRFGAASLSLAYVGTEIGRQPLELERWPLIQQPAPEGTTPGWQAVSVTLEQGLMEVFLNGNKLNERPLPAERAVTDIAEVAAGFAGAYAGHIGEASPAEARIDGFFYRVP